MDYKRFVAEQVRSLREVVGDGKAINALSGGVDSSVVTLLSHRALGDALETVFVDSGLMREGEPHQVGDTFRQLGVPVEIVDARAEFLGALAGVTDPEEKRHAITDTFYRSVFARLVRRTGARFLLHGTILTDVEESVAGIKRQHNILAQLGIDPEREYGYQVLEPLVQLRKDGVREVARILGLPASALSPDPVSRPGSGGPHRGRGDRRAIRDGPPGHSDRGGRAERLRGVPVSGGAAAGQGDGNSQWTAGIRPDHCGPMRPQCRRADRRHRRASLGAIASDLRADHRDPRREPLPVRPDAQTAGHH